jgi:hypothetical protein
MQKTQKIHKNQAKIQKTDLHNAEMVILPVGQILQTKRFLHYANRFSAFLLGFYAFSALFAPRDLRGLSLAASANSIRGDRVDQIMQKPQKTYKNQAKIQKNDLHDAEMVILPVGQMLQTKRFLHYVNRFSAFLLGFYKFSAFSALFAPRDLRGIHPTAKATSREAASRRQAPAESAENAENS